MTIERRHFLAIAAAATGGLVYSQGLAAMLANTASGTDAMSIPMMQRDAWINQSVNAFSKKKRALVSAMAETLIPKTDTPGAIDAGVPKFLELLYDQWMGPGEKTLFDAGLAEADKRARDQHDSPFAQCNAGVQKSILETIEEEQADHPWFELGGESVGKDRQDIPFMALFKEITATGFFMSEVGAQQVLRYDPMPGQFDGETELTSNDSSWASVPLM